MASFENIDTFAFLGVLCSIAPDEKLSAGRLIDYLPGNAAPAIEIPSISHIATPAVPVLPATTLVSGPHVKSCSDFWFWALFCSIIAIGAAIIGYLYWKDKHCDEKLKPKTT